LYYFFFIQSRHRGYSYFVRKTSSNNKNIILPSIRQLWSHQDVFLHIVLRVRVPYSDKFCACVINAASDGRRGSEWPAPGYRGRGYRGRLNSGVAAIGMYCQAGRGLFGQRNWHDDNNHHYPRPRAYNNNKTVCVYYLSVNITTGWPCPPETLRSYDFGTARGGCA